MWFNHRQNKILYECFTHYSGDLKTGNSKTGHIQKPDVLQNKGIQKPDILAAILYKNIQKLDILSAILSKNI